MSEAITITVPAWVFVIFTMAVLIQSVLTTYLWWLKRKIAQLQKDLPRSAKEQTP